MSASERDDDKVDGTTTREVKLELERRRPSPEAVAAFADLQKDAPPGAGPIVREAARLVPTKETPESDRKEHVGRAALRTNPVGQGVEPRVMRVPRRDADAHVTSPDAYKRAKLGLAPAIAAKPIPGRTTQPLANVPPPVEPSASPVAISDVEPKPRRRNWLWAAAVFVLMGLMGGSLIWYTEAVRTDERDRVGSATPSATATARATATTEPSVPAVSSKPSSLTGSATASAPPSSSAPETVSARPSVPTPTVKRTAKPSAQPSTGPTATSERPND